MFGRATIMLGIGPHSSLHCLVTEARVSTTCLSLSPGAEWPGVKLQPSELQVQRPNHCTTRPRWRASIKGCIPSLKCQMGDQEWMNPVDEISLVSVVLWAPSSALTLWVEWQDRHPASEKNCSSYVQRLSKLAWPGIFPGKTTGWIRKRVVHMHDAWSCNGTNSMQKWTYSSVTLISTSFSSNSDIMRGCRKTANDND